MKNVIRLREIINRKLNEIHHKEKYGYGIEHTIYPLKNHPDKLIKVGDKDTVDKWVEVFRSNPEIFPKIFNSGDLPRTNNKKGYAIIEKVDVDKAMREWELLEEKLEEVGVIDFEDGAFGRDITDIYVNYEGDPKTITFIASKLKKYDVKAYDLFIKWFSLFKDCQRAIEKVVGHGTLVDAHKYNFGYGQDGKLKCFDI